MKQSRNSLYKTIDTNIRVVLAISIVTMLLAFLVYQRGQRMEIITDFKNDMSVKLENQIERLLPAIILPEQKPALPMLFEHIKNDELLDDVTIIDTLPDALNKPENCFRSTSKINCVYATVSKGRILVGAPIKVGAREYGYLLKAKPLPDMKFFSSTFGLILLIAFCITGSYIAIISKIRNHTAKAFKDLKFWLEASIQEPGESSPLRNSYSEVNDLSLTISSISNQEKVNRKKAIVAEIAQEVGHDIRSPLTALSVITNNSTSIDSDTRKLLVTASQRIQNIAERLSFKQNDLNSDQWTIYCLPVKQAVITCVKEKEIEISCNRNHIDITIDFQNIENPYIRLPCVEFRRLFSNILNNAISSIGDKDGSISIRLEAVHKETLKIHIMDNGAGIPREALKHVFDRGFSTRKNGSGLGLYHAKRTIERAGGKIEIRNNHGLAGASVELEFNARNTPDPYIESLNLNGIEHIVILDDDFSVHQTWQHTLNPFISSHSSIQVHHFNKGLTDWDTSNNKTKYLVDYDLGPDNLTGLEIIKRSKLQSASVLVTNRFDDEDFVLTCNEQGIKILPKIEIENITLAIS